jgi:hypothetical protein
MSCHQVDKVVISQDSLGRFINDLYPGAYDSMIKVDFKVLDGVHIKPLGVYGSQSQIVEFLENINAVDTDM